MVQLLQLMEHQQQELVVAVDMVQVVEENQEEQNAGGGDVTVLGADGSTKSPLNTSGSSSFAPTRDDRPYSVLDPPKLAALQAQFEETTIRKQNLEEQVTKLGWLPN